MEGNDASAFVLHGLADLQPIDPRKARFPCCIVWAPLPLISWFLPFIGHLGICREDGVILDFAGPNFVCVDHFAFGAATRYMRLSQDKCCFPKHSEADNHSEVDPCVTSKLERDFTWDEVLRKSTQEFQHRGYNLFICNCHSFVANNLNRMMYSGHNNWNVVNLAILIFLNGTWVNKTAIVRAYLPFLVVMALGYFMFGSMFLIIWGALALSLVGWFLVGTYCFDRLIQV